MTAYNEYPLRRHQSTSTTADTDSVNPNASSSFTGLPRPSAMVQNAHNTRHPTLQETQSPFGLDNRTSRHSFSPNKYGQPEIIGGGNATPIYRTQERTPMTNVHDFEWERSYVTTESMNGSQDRHYLDRGPQTRERVKRIPFHPGQEEREVILRLKPTSPHSTYPQPDITRGISHAKPSSGFLPSPYEYQHIKVRKRSNLPKQSTEIMKVWFDQVNHMSVFCIVTLLIWIRISPIHTLAKTKKQYSQMCVYPNVTNITR